jgi:uncharacterized protein (DUF2147 family)
MGAAVVFAILGADNVQLRGCVVFPLCNIETWNRIP